MDSVAGASAIILPVSENTQWEHQRSQLHNILKALPQASRLPLLLVSGSCEDSLGGSSIAEKLRLRDFQSKFMVSFLKSLEFYGLYSDERLREGLKWLARGAPVQPLVCSVKMRKLVLFHLIPLLDTHDLSPNQCISRFNEALRRSLQKVSAAVDANPHSWPCPEIGLLDDWSYFPSIGWSSSARMEPLLRALGNLKLPLFKDDGHMGIKWDTELELAICLLRYLTESSQMMGKEMAADEAWKMTQYFAKVEFHGSARFIVPNWAMIFRRVFHWRLMDLPDEPNSSVYVLARDDPFTSDFEAFQSLQLPYVDEPSLDEMLAVSFIPPAPETFDTNVDYYDDDGEVRAAMVEDDEGRSNESGGLVASVMHDITNSEPETGAVASTMVTKAISSILDGFWELTAIVDKVQNGNQKRLNLC